MRSTTLILLVGVLCAGVSACSNLGVRGHGAAAPVAAAPAAEPAAAAALPDVELSGELLYQILEAEIALQRRYYDIAGSRYLELAETTRDPRFAEMATKIAIFSRDDARAQRASALWAELDPAQIEAHQMVVVASLRAGQVDAAAQHVDALLAAGTGLEDGGFRLVASLMNREEDVQAAIRLLDGYTARHSDSAAAYFYLAQFALRVGQLPKAEAAIDRCIALQPAAVEAMALRVKVLQMQKRDEEALNYLAEAARKDRKSVV